MNDINLMNIKFYNESYEHNFDLSHINVFEI